jgi:hypothetical protein
MPGVGGKKYPYTKKGMAMAKAEAKKTGKPMKMHEKTEGKKERVMEYGKKSGKAMKKGKK